MGRGNGDHGGVRGRTGTPRSTRAACGFSHPMLECPIACMSHEKPLSGTHEYAITRRFLPQLLTITAILGMPLAAQPSPAHTIPKVFSGTYAPGAHSLPLARSRGFTQFWYRGSDLPPPLLVRAIGWRVDEDTTVQAMSLKLEIVLSNTAKTATNLSMTFADNLQKQVLFSKMRWWNLPVQNRPSNPDHPALWMTGDRPFIFTGPNFIVQVDHQTTTVPITTLYFTDGYAMPVTPHFHMTSGKSCAGTDLIASFDTGASTYTLSLAGAPANVPAVLFLGTENRRLGTARLPLDLSAFGAPGCWLGLAPIISIPLKTDASGRLLLTAKARLRNSTLYSQAATRTNSNVLGYATSNVAHSILGNQGLSTYLYNWSRFGPQAQYGPFLTNRGVVTLLR